MDALSFNASWSHGSPPAWAPENSQPGGCMSGANPYIAPAHVEAARQPYRITVRHGESATEIAVDPSRIPYQDDGLPGSVLDILLGHDVAIDHACGGVAACSTCHVHVFQGMESTNEISDAEADQLDYAADCRPNSRLACQCVPNGKMSVSVSIPSWNRNQAHEEHS